MQRCFQLALKGMGSVAPNPLVGAVIVKDGKIIGEGFHREFGGKHAEINAIENVKDKNDLIGATLYVNLEPCSHHGKTPPCADKILETGISKVVISGADPSLKVNGKGIEKLTNAGLQVVANVLNDKEENINKRFRLYHRKRRPYIILKWAQSDDGFMDIIRTNNEKGSFQLSNEASKRMLHKWRSEEMAILIGTNTAQIDNPSLNVRLVEGKNPLRVVIDLNEQLDNGLKIFKDDIPTVIYTEKESRVDNLIEYVKVSRGEGMLEVIMNDLFKREIQSVIVEGGKAILDSFLQANLWDEIRQIKSQVLLKEGLLAPVLPLEPCSIENIGSDNLLIYKKSQ